MKTLSRTLSYLRPYLWLQFAALTCAIVVTVLGLAFPWLLKILIDDVLVAKKLAVLAALCIAFIVIAVVSQTFSIIRHYLFIKIGEQAGLDLRRHLFDHIQAQGLLFLSKEKTGKLMSHFTGDATAMQTLYTSTLVDFATNSLTCVVTLVVLFRINIHLALVSLPTIPIFAFCIWVFKKPLRKSGHAVQESNAKTVDTLQETISGAREIKAFTQEQRQSDGLSDLLRDRLGALLRQGLWGTSSGAFAQVTATVGTMAVLWVGGRMVIANEISSGVLVAFITYLGRLFGPIAWFVGLNASLQGALAGADRVFEILDTTPDVSDRDDAREPGRVEGAVEFSSVCFAYGDDEVLTDISFSARPGEMLAFVGPSGSGKTTLMNLIPRFADPTSGRIKLDDHHLTDLTQQGLRANIGQVFQDPFLFSGTITDNLLFGRPDATMAEIESAAKAANAHDFITELPEAYDTQIGERGICLSGGQRQRLAIARAILRKPRILLLDEATSALDSASEASVQDALKRLMQTCTSFVVAHRLSTILHADRILVLDGGRLVGSGKHRELLGSSPLYRNLCERQFGREPAFEGALQPSGIETPN